MSTRSSESSERSQKSPVSICDDVGQYYHGDLRREFVADLLRDNGDFLLRKSSDGPFCLSVKWAGMILHYQPTLVNNRYSFGGKEFLSFDDLILFHWKKRVPLSTDRKTLLLRPVKHVKKVYKRGDAEIVGKLGGGNFGDVYKIRIKSEGGKEYAMKTMRANVSNEAKEAFRSEMALMLVIQHDNVVHCFGTVEDDAEIRIVLELINCGSLDKLLRKGKLTQKGKARIVCQVARGVAYLHSRVIIHRDLASRNILVHRNDDGTIVAKVSDFGLSRRDETGKGYELRTAQKLPLKWLAPECFVRRFWTCASDVWSFGVLMWEVYTNGGDPYGERGFPNQLELSKFIAKGGCPSALNDILPQLNNLMTLCWTVDMIKRPSMDYVCAELDKVYPLVKNATNQGASQTVSNI